MMTTSKPQQHPWYSMRYGKQMSLTEKVARQDANADTHAQWTENEIREELSRTSPVIAGEYNRSETYQ